MSEHTKMPHISRNNELNVLYVTHNAVTYAIPQEVANKYIINSEGSIPAEEVFSRLINKLTKAGAFLKGLRAREALTQVAFAKKINVTQASLSSMENGRRPIGKIVAKRIEKVFGIDYRYFLE